MKYLYPFQSFIHLKAIYAEHQCFYLGEIFPVNIYVNTIYHNDNVYILDLIFRT